MKIEYMKIKGSKQKTNLMSKIKKVLLEVKKDSGLFFVYFYTSLHFRINNFFLT